MKVVKNQMKSDVFKNKIASLFLTHRSAFGFSFTCIAIVTTLLASFLLRFDFSLPASEIDSFGKLLGPALVIKTIVFWKYGLNHGWWRYASLADAVDIAQATLVSSVALTLFVVFVFSLEGIPRSVLILDAGLTFLLFSGVRFVVRLIRENYLPFMSGNGNGQVKTLIVGAGEAGQSIVREIRKSKTLQNDVVGYIDSGPHRLNSRFQGVPVLGDGTELIAICKKHAVEEIIVAIPSASAQEMREIVDLGRETGATVKTLPALSDLINGKVSIQQIRDVDVQDLLGRHQISLDMARIESYLKGKRVLVTGAAGSIGSEICRQLVRYDPAHISLLDNAESPLFHIEREMVDRYSEIDSRAFLGDIRDSPKMARVFEERKPQVVFHAAAYKHVPMMEQHPGEAISTNVHGTRVVADLALKFGVESFVMISTDKAVNPTNIMGASKRTAEIYIQSLSKSSKTRFTTVRFGNVLGSNGSVVPIFKEQIKNGGPIQVTHPEVTRFFMTIAEATQLVLQAGSMGVGGEVFLLDMGKSVKIVELAEELIRLSGFTPYKDIDIEFTGLRPGEKLFEELLIAGENVKPTEHESVRIACATDYESDLILKSIDEIYELRNSLDSRCIVEKLKQIVAEYSPAEKWQDLSPVSNT